ncbi:54S ribosomal protein L4 mitochondrial [Ophidiomyces ophidiicola]|nr:54S ribosomal protein L4 mitochondrial [Ophidiomyces ophidiicola]
MALRSIASFFYQQGGLPLAELPPAFLAPALYSPSLSAHTQRSQFSTSSSVTGRDRNRLRGVSAIHRTGPKHPLPVSKYPLPTPAPQDQSKRPLNPNHGLWGFFGPNKQSLSTPEEEYAHGRPWSVQELRQKSWDDLHCLWWVAVRERNRIATSTLERKRLAAGYGDYESQNRDKTVRTTQKAIKHVLRERWYAWNEARDLYNGGYRPSSEVFLEEDHESRSAPEINPEHLDSSSQSERTVAKTV